MLPPDEVLRPARIVCVAKKSLLGCLIRYVTGGPWNHCGLLDPPVFVLEAKDLNGTTATKQEVFFDQKDIYKLGIYEVSNMNWESKMTTMAEAWKMQSKPYDTLQLLGIYLHKRFPFLTPHRMILDSEEKLICSEFILRAFEKAGINLIPENVHPGLVDPNMLVSHPRIKLVYLWTKPE